MLFTLLHQVDSTECSLVSHFFGFDIFGRKEKFLGIHQQHAMLSGFMDHPLALFDSHGQRLFADNVFAARAHSMVISACRWFGVAIVIISISGSRSEERRVGTEGR